ncbi:MAG TPA: hypothetical protein VFY93_07325 [Planctomycetota bacterium]|nr:hypothetical protein [Planctomycetota bacterium]
MSLIFCAGGALLLLLVSAIGFRRPLLAAVVAGGLGGPAFYVWLGGHLARARGEGRFYSFPFGGYRLGDAEILLSAGVWAFASGVASYAATRLLRPRTP